MVPYSIHKDRLEPSISRARLKQVNTAREFFQMGPSLLSSLEFSLSWIRLARARAIPAHESNLQDTKRLDHQLQLNTSTLSSLETSTCFNFNRPVRAHADVVHVELDGFRLLFVFKMVVCQQIVQLIHHRGRWGSSFREGRHLKDTQTFIQI